MPRLILRPETSVLLMVHVQPTFMPGGELPVPAGDEIVEPARAFLERFSAVPAVAAQEWHPPGHISFASRHPGKKPLDIIELYGHPQTLWPDHAVRGTRGAALAPGLPLDRFDLILRTGTRRDADSYSVFRENWGPDGARRPTGLAGYLRERDITQVVIWGLALDVCVAWSARDSAAYGFSTYVVVDLCRSIAPEKQHELLGSLRSDGVQPVQSSDIKLAD